MKDVIKYNTNPNEPLRDKPAYKKFMNNPKVEKRIEIELNPKQELFCKYYATERDCFGNGVQAYLKVYSTKAKPISYKAARVSAYHFLTNPNICKRIRELMDIYVSDEVVDKELAEVILQHGDLKSKVAAIREYNRVKDRVVNKLEVTDKRFNDYDDEELEEELLARRSVRRRNSRRDSEKERIQSS